MVAQKFGKYTLLHRLAVGGMAEIFVARHLGVKGFSRKIVIKRIRSHLSTQDAFVNMFLNEAKLAAQLSHSNICQIYDLGRIEDTFFIAMEYVRGRDMRRVLKKTEITGIPFPLEYAMYVAGQVCEGLYYAHRLADDAGLPLHVVHRDVTPENLMVSYDGELKILDFGIAKAENLISETRVGEIKGKLGYMSPEQVRGDRVDHRSDLFSLGTVLFEWVTGERLFNRDSEMDVLRDVAEGKIRAPRAVKPDIPDQVEQILLKALQRDPDMRYQSAWDFQYAISQFMSRHVFNPGSIQLSNYIRQLFSDEIDEESRLLSKADQETTGPEGDVTASLAVDDITSDGQAANGRKKTSRIKRSESGSNRNGLQAVRPDAVRGEAEDPDPLLVELLASDPGKLSVTVDITHGDYQKLYELAQRNTMTVPALIREILAQYTRFM